MLTVNSSGADLSAAFTTATTATIRKPRARLKVTWTDPYVDPGLSATATGFENYHITHVRDVLGEVDLTGQVIDRVETTPYEYTILDGTWVLDPTVVNEKHLAPSTDEEADLYQFGYYSDENCDGAGDFGTPPELTVTFSTPRPVSILKIVGEETLDQYATDFDIYVYYNTAPGTYHKHVTGNTTVNLEIDISSEEINDATSMKLVINSWSEANTIAKIVEFLFVEQDTFDGDVIISVNSLEEREIRQGSLPVGNISSNEIDIELQNISITRYNGNTYTDPFFPGNSDSFYSELLRPNRKIELEEGFELPGGTTEYVKSGTFWTLDWSCKNSSYLTAVSARDRMEILRKATFEFNDLLEDYNLYEIFIAVCNHAKLNIPLIDLEWYVSTADQAILEDIVVPYCWFEKESYFNAIRIIAELALGQAYMSKDDVLILETYHANDYRSSDLTITDDNIFSTDLPASTDDMTNYVEVNLQKLSESTENSDIYTSDEIDITGSATLELDEITYSNKPVKDPTITITNQTGGVSVTVDEDNSEFFPWGCRLTVVNNNANTGTFKIKITGIQFAINDTPVKIAYDSTMITQNGKKTYKYNNNHLLQDEDIAQTIANKILEFYKDPRRDLAIEWRGNPALELGDVIRVNDYDEYVNFVVYKNKLSYGNGISCTTMARRIDDQTTTTSGA